MYWKNDNPILLYLLEMLAAEYIYPKNQQVIK